MKILRVGDPHIKVSNLEDSEKMMEFIYAAARTHKVDRVEFLGDLFDTHGVVRVEVLDFWLRWIETISSRFPVLTIIGNHDLQGTYNSTLSPLNVFRSLKDSNVKIVEVNEPFICEMSKIAYISYQHSSEKFIELSNSIPDHIDLVVCHQTFQGATYENGFYAEDGIELSRVKQKKVISGHIHKTQNIGKCFYPGTPKWDNAMDAGEDKGVWIFEDDKEPLLLSTRKFVTPVIKLTWNEGSEEPEIPKNAKVYLELNGKTAWINKVKKKFKSNVNIKGVPTDRLSERNSVSRDKLSINEYLDAHFELVDGVSKDEIKNHLKMLEIDV